MGREVRCAAEFDGWSGEGRLLLETDDLIFRGERRLSLPRSTLRNVRAREDWLEIDWAGGKARFAVGRAAERWANDILNPKSLLDKLDLEPAHRAVTIGLRDTDFVEQLRERVSAVDGRLGAGPYDMIFLRADLPPGLVRLEGIRARMQPGGAVWVVTPKGVPAMAHEVVVRAAKMAGLVDVKTARWSDTHTALKLVIPKRDRAV